jgi:hypothetical protein
MSQIQREYEGRGVVVLAVNVWEEEDAFRAFVEDSEHDLRWVRASDEAVKAFGLRGVPTYVLIDREGRVQWTSGFFSLFRGTAPIRENLDRVLEE